MHAIIRSLAHYIPEGRQTSADVESLLREHGRVRIPSGVVEILTKIKARPISGPEEYPSTMAAEASKRALAKAGLTVADIDLLLFASAGHDVAEPATGNIVQDLLGAECPIIDVKNACNSFLNGLQVARAFVESGAYQRVLVCTGETPSKISRYDFADRAELREGFAGLTLGDAAAAAIVEASPERLGIYYSQFTTLGGNWKLAVLPGGGARHPFGDEFMRFEGDGTKLKDAFIAVNKPLIDNALKTADKTYDDFAQIFIHQVSYPFLEETIQKIGAPKDKVYVTVKDYGNMVSASLPAAISLATDQGVVKPGDHILVLGLASGISIGIVMVEL